MHIRKCNENSRKEKRRGKEPEGWGGAQFYICEMLAKLETGKAAKII